MLFINKLEINSEKKNNNYRNGNCQILKYLYISSLESSQNVSISFKLPSQI